MFLSKNDNPSLVLVQPKNQMDISLLILRDYRFFLPTLPTPFLPFIRPGPVTQSVTCLATGASLTADPGVASPILAWPRTFMEIDHEIISMVIHLPLTHSRKVVVSYKRKYVHEVLVHCLVKLAQEKSVVR